MSNQYNFDPNKFPKPIYSYLDKETDYRCQGTSCTCKYLNDRSEFDKMENGIVNYDYLFNSSKINKNSYKYKPDSKHFGI
jgi:hypothetical protein